MVTEYEEVLQERFGDFARNSPQMFARYVLSCESRGGIEQVDRELRTLLGSLQHDLNAPLRTIAGFSGLVDDDSGQYELLGNAAETLVREIQGAVGYRPLQNLVYGAEQIFGVDLREYVPNNAEMQEDARRIYGAQRRFLRTVATRLGIGEAYEFNLHESVQDLTRGEIQTLIDPDSCLRAAAGYADVVGLLVDNAYFHSDAAYIAIGAVEMDGRKSVGLVVADNGRGICKSVLPRLFEAGSSTGARNGAEGKGLGTYGAKRIAQRHGGEIEVYTKKGEGSVFVVEIPARHVREHRPCDLDNLVSHVPIVGEALARF